MIQLISLEFVTIAEKTVPWIITAIIGVYSILKDRKSIRQMGKEMIKSDVDSISVDISNRKTLNDELDRALNNNRELHKQLKDLLTLVDKQEQEIIHLKRQLNVFETFKPLINKKK